jgi:SAM-dependent methyltransferase
MALISAAETRPDGYDHLAPFYDQFTAAYAYEPWIAAIEGRAKSLGLSGKRALDLGCGTGNSTLPLIARGYSVVGCDISERMVEQARRKVPDLASSFFVADMRELPPLGEFDLVLCIDDGINHLLSDSELEDAFAGVARALAPGGVFAFDANSLLTFRTSFAETFVSEGDGRLFCWRGAGSAEFQPGEMASASLDVFAERDDGLWERHTTQTIERHHPRQAITAALEQSGLGCCAILGQHRGARLEDAADENRHIKLLYFAKRLH